MTKISAYCFIYVSRCRVLNAVRFGWRPLLDCSAITLPIWESARLGGGKVNFALGKIPLRGNSHRKCINSLQVQETAKDRAKFGWLPLREVAAVMKPRCKSH